VAATNDALESHFVRKHPKNTTLFAVYITTLVMYILYRLPRRGAAVLLAGMRSVLKSQPSLFSLATEVPKDPRKLLALYDLDPVTCSYVCCPACYYLYPYSAVKAKMSKGVCQLPIQSLNILYADGIFQRTPRWFHLPQ